MLLAAAVLALALDPPDVHEACTYRTLSACSPDGLLWLMTFDGVPDDPEFYHGSEEWYAEVVRRIPLTELLGALARTGDEHLRQHIVQALWDRPEAEITETYARLMHDPPRDTADCRMATQLAKGGDPRALGVLRRDLARLGRPSRCGFSSAEWGGVAPIFGQQKDYAAAPALIEALGAASLNLADGALEALDLLYPGASADDVKDPAAAHDYYRRRHAERNKRK
jgi:hypothetical protein